MKILKIKYKIPSITNWATTSALAVVKNKIPSVSNLVQKKENYNFIKKTITLRLMKLKRKLLVMIMINILLLQNLISLQKIFLS